MLAFFDSEAIGYLILNIIALMIVIMITWFIKVLANKMSVKYENDKQSINWLGIALLWFFIAGLLFIFSSDIASYTQINQFNVMIFVILPVVLAILIIRFKVMER